MRAENADLLAGALALAYKYCDLPALRRAYAQVAGNGKDLPQALLEGGALNEARAEKLRRGAAMADRLRTDAVYGMVAMRNRLVGGEMLNACMEESRRSGYEKSLSEVLIERGVVTTSLDEAILSRQSELLPDLLAKESALAATIDLERDPEETAELKLAMLLGEVAAKISFLSREDLEKALRVQERVAQGLSPEEELPQRPASGAVSLRAPAPVPGPAVPGPGAHESEDPIKGYELLEKLGSGAMGAVLKSRKRDTGEIVALKILKPELANDSEYVDRFQREAKAVARLSHKNIVRAVQVGRSGDYYFFAMEFLQGQTISDMIKAQGRLPERFAIQVTACIASALSHAWQHQIIHRDIKPDNVMVCQDGAVKLTDLGLARTAKKDSTLTITGVVMGSPAYISPEQATGEKNLDARSDIYSLGATLYHMLSGKVPYDGETPLHVMLKHMNDPLPDIRKAVPEVSEATRLMIMKMMAKRPEGRFQAAQQVEAAARMVEEALGRGEVPPIPPGLAPPRPKAVAAAAGDPNAMSGSGSRRKKAKKRMGTSQSGERKFSTSQSGERRKKKKKKKKEQDAKQKELGERLRRMAKQRRRRF